MNEKQIAHLETYLNVAYSRSIKRNTLVNDIVYYPTVISLFLFHSLHCGHSWAPPRGYSIVQIDCMTLFI